MADLIPNPSGPGWVEPPEAKPTHCPLGHELVPGGFVRGWDVGRPYWHCEQPGHADPASRWVFLSGPAGPTRWELGAADGKASAPGTTKSAHGAAGKTPKKMRGLAE